MNCRGCCYATVCALPTGIPFVRVNPDGLVEACSNGELFAFGLALTRHLGAERRVLRERSHTTKVAVDITDPDALERAATRLTWAFNRMQNVELFDRSVHTGPAVQPPGWKYPIVAEDGQLAFDNFNGVWGNPGDIETLKATYTIEKAKLEAEAQGYDYEEVNGELVIYQPGGRSISVGPDGKVQAHGFSGCGCTDATRFVEAALGKTLDIQFSESYYQTAGDEIGLAYDAS